MTIAGCKQLGQGAAVLDDAVDKTLPSASMATAMTCSLSSILVEATCGRLIGTACWNNGAVMMKMTNRTSITSTSGVVLISAIGWVTPRCQKEPKDILASSPLIAGRAHP